MNWKLLIGITGVVTGLVLTLLPFSLLIGWNLVSLLIFWFVIVPIISKVIPSLIPENKQRLLQSSVGIIIFYGIMIFMIYKQSQTDYFRVMALSGVINLILLIAGEVFKTNLFKKRSTVPNTK